MTELAVAPLCGDGSLLYDNVPTRYVAAVIPPEGLAAALPADGRFTQSAPGTGTRTG